MTRPVALALLLGASPACTLIPLAPDAPPPPVKRAAVNGTELAYVEEGAGVPVVFVHSTGGDWRSFEAVRPAISSRFRYLAYSRRYHFPNPLAGDGADYNEATHVADLTAFVRGLESGPVHLVGVSSGAAVVLRTALAHPEIVRSAVVDEPYLPSLIAGLPEAREIMAEARASQTAMEAAARAGDDGRAAELLVDWAAGEPGAFSRLPEDRQRLWNDNLWTVGRQTLAPQPQPLRCADVARIRAPVLVLRGESTTPFFRLVSDTLAGCLPPGTARELVSGAGHWNHLESPRAFRDVVLRFLEKH